MYVLWTHTRTHTDTHTHNYVKTWIYADSVWTLELPLPEGMATPDLPQIVSLNVEALDAVVHVVGDEYDVTAIDGDVERQMELLQEVALWPEVARHLAVAGEDVDTIRTGVGDDRLSSARYGDAVGLNEDVLTRVPGRK